MSDYLPHSIFEFIPIQLNYYSDIIMFNPIFAQSIFYMIIIYDIVYMFLVSDTFSFVPTWSSVTYKVNFSSRLFIKYSLTMKLTGFG